MDNILFYIVHIAGVFFRFLPNVIQSDIRFVYRLLYLLLSIYTRDVMFQTRYNRPMLAREVPVADSQQIDILTGERWIESGKEFSKHVFPSYVNIL